VTGYYRRDSKSTPIFPPETRETDNM